MRVATRTFWRAGAVLYVLWGILHVVVGAIPVYRYFASGPASMLAFHELEVAVVDDALLHASHLITEHSVNLIAFGLLGVIVAVTLVARGRALGFWIAAIVLGIVDVSFVAAEIATGHLALMPAGIGPLLYLLALASTGVALIRQRRGATVAEYA